VAYQNVILIVHLS